MGLHCVAKRRVFMFYIVLLSGLISAVIGCVFCRLAIGYESVTERWPGVRETLMASIYLCKSHTRKLKRKALDML